MWNKNDVKRMENIWLKDWRPDLWSIWASGPIFNTPLKEAQIDIYNKTNAKPVEISEEMTKDRKLILGPKRPMGWASEARILLTSQSTCNEYVKQHWCETNEKRGNDQTPEFWVTLGPKMVQKLGFWGPYYAHLWN